MMEKKVLEHALSVNNWWMSVSTIAIAIGILGEYALEFVFEKEITKNKTRMAIWLFFGAVVIGGVVGEWLVERRSSLVSELLQQGNDSEVVRANAAAAKTQANARVAENRAAEAQREAARLRKALQQERMARRQLEVAATGRSLSPTVRSKMVKRLKVYSRQRAWILYEPIDPEARQFAIEMASMLAQANWMPTQPEETALILSDNSFATDSTGYRGIWLKTSHDRSSREAGIALANELTAAGFALTRQMGQGADCGVVPIVCVTIEHRPARSSARPFVGTLSGADPSRSRHPLMVPIPAKSR